MGTITAFRKRAQAIQPEVLYTARVSASSGRVGRVVSDDGALQLTLAAPHELGGSGRGTNPEQLFAAGYAACFGSAIAHVARVQKLSTGPVTVCAEVSLTASAQSCALAIALEVEIPELDPEQAQELLTAAHSVCPYSRAIHGNLELEIQLKP